MTRNKLPAVPRHLGRFLWDSRRSYLTPCLGAAAPAIWAAAVILLRIQTVATI